MIDTPIRPLRKFSDFVRNERTLLTDQWMRAVLGDVDLVEGDKLTYQQLANRLPEILDGLCAALDICRSLTGGGRPSTTDWLGGADLYLLGFPNQGYENGRNYHLKRRVL